MKPEEIVSKAIYLAKEWETNQMKRSTEHISVAGQTLVPENCALVRSDAAWREDLMLAGFGWTVSDQNRTRSFSVPAYFVGSSLAAEGLALLEAVTKCKELGYTRICCESDSKQLIQAVTAVTEASELYGITADINAIASAFEAISFQWISRINNVVADNLAKQVLADETAFIVPPNIT